MRQALLWSGLLVLAALPLPAGASHAQASLPLLADDPRVTDALAWLDGGTSHGAWVDDQGCVHGRSDYPCSTAATKWLAVVAAHTGLDPATWPQDDASVIGYLLDHAGDLREGAEGGCGPEPCTERVLSLAKSVLAFQAAGLDARSVPLPEGGNRDLVAELLGEFDGHQFGRTDPVNDDAWAVIALTSAGYAGPEVGKALDHLAAAQRADGGIPWTYAAALPDTDSTAAAVMAAAPHGRDLFLDRARGYLQGARLDTGEHAACWPNQHRGLQTPEPVTESTAWVLQAIVAMGEDPLAWSAGGRSPIDCLISMQNSDGGFDHAPDGDPGRGSSFLSTYQAVVSLAWAPYGSVSEPTSRLVVPQQATVGKATTVQVPGGWVRDGQDTHERHRFTPTKQGEVVFHGLTFAPHPRPAEVRVHVGAAEGSSSGSSGTSSGATHVPPSASLSAPATAERNVSTTVNVTATPGDGRVVAFQVDWGEGATSPWSATGQLQHTYDELGEQTVRARAQDANGYTSAWTSATLHVVDARPRLTLDGPEQVLRHTPFQLTATVQDPDGPAPNVTWHAEGNQLAGANVSLELSTPGAHLLRAVAEDRAGNQATASLTVKAVNRAPVLGTVGPQVARANATHVLTAEATDPDGDPLRFTWTHGNASATGGQFHLPTGAPGLVNLTVNVSDPHGAWTLANLTVRVAEQPAQATPPAPATVVARNETVQPVEAPAPPPGTPRVQLPALVQGSPGAATLLEGRASQENGTVRQVEVALGEPVPVRGTTSFQALVPALPNGTYELAARAMGEAGTWGPWTNATLVVAGQEPLTRANTSPIDEPARETPLPWLAAPLALAPLALARPPDRMSGRPRRPAGGHRGTRGAGAEGTGKEREAGMAGGHVDAARRRRWPRARPAALRAVRARQGSCKSWWPAPGGVTAELDNAVSPSPRKGAALPSPRLLAVPSLSSHAAPADSVRRFKRWRWP